MKKISIYQLLLLFSFIGIIFVSLLTSGTVQASGWTKCENQALSIKNAQDLQNLVYDPNRQSLSVTMYAEGQGNLSDDSYTLRASGISIEEEVTQEGGNNEITFTFTKPWIKGNKTIRNSYTLYLFRNSNLIPFCYFPGITIRATSDDCIPTTRYKGIENPTCWGNEAPIYISATSLIDDNALYSGDLEIKRKAAETLANSSTSSPGTMPYTNIGKLEPKNTSYNIVIQKPGGDNLCEEKIKVTLGCDPAKAPTTEVVNLCNQIPDPEKQQLCKECMGPESDGSGGGVWTGLGCLSFSPSEFIKQVLQIAIGLGGGIAFLLLIYGAFLMTTASGNPEAADNAKQIITGAITGLLVIIFSVVILNIIGVQILQIPGL